MRKLKKRFKIHPPVTPEEAYAIGRQLLGIATAKDYKLIDKKKRRKLKRRKLDR